MSPGGAEAGRGGPWVGAGAGRRAPAPCGQLSVRRGPAPHLGQSWLRLLGTTAEAYRPGWAALTWMRSWARTVRRAPSHRHMWTPAQAPWVPVGWGPCPQGQAVCSQRLLQPPQGRGIQSQGPPGSDQCPTPAPAHPQAHAVTHPPTHPLTKLPRASQAARQELGPQDQTWPLPSGALLSRRGGGGARGADGSGGHGCVADRFLASSARPWGWAGGWAQDGPPGSLGLRGSLGRPRQGPWQPMQLPLRPPASCPLSAGCALRLPTSRLVTPTLAGGGRVSPDLSPP